MATGLPSLKALRAFSTIAVWKVQLVAHVGDELRLELAALWAISSNRRAFSSAIAD
jgi:hypothetical protein